MAATRPTVTSLSESQAKLLIRLLGEQDCLFVPFREVSAWWASAWAARWAYSRVGLPWRSAASGAAGQKQAERDLRELVNRELVSRKRSKTKTKLVRLSDAGDQLARALAGIEGIDAGIATVHELHRHIKRREENGTTLFDGWIPETDLSGGVGWGDGKQNELAVVQAVALPALVRGWAESHCTSSGRHVYYRPVGELPEANKIAIPGAIPNGRDLYQSALWNAREQLYSNIEAPAGELGAVPLPVSMGILTPKAVVDTLIEQRTP